MSRFSGPSRSVACRSCPSGCAGSPSTTTSFLRALVARQRFPAPRDSSAVTASTSSVASGRAGPGRPDVRPSRRRATPMHATSATSGWRCEHLLGLGRVDVDATGHDHVGEAVGDEHEPVVVDVADLAEREHAGRDVGFGGLHAGRPRTRCRDRWCRGSTAGLRRPRGSSTPSSSTTSASNGGTARPTDPGWASQSVELIEHTVPDSVPPYDSDSTGPHHSIIARLTSIGHLPPGVRHLADRRHVVAVAHVVRQRQAAARSGSAP